MDFRHRCRLSVWLATPLSACLIMRHYCRVISKRHRCRSDTDLATLLSGGCSVSAVIQSKTCDRLSGVLLCDSGVTKQLLPAQKGRVKLLTADIFHFRQKSRLLVFQAASSFIGLCVYVGLNGEVCGSFGFFYLLRAVCGAVKSICQNMPYFVSKEI